MTQLYYRDLRRRIEALEAQCFPEPEPIVTVYALDPDDGLPTWVTTLGRSYGAGKKANPSRPKSSASPSRKPGPPTKRKQGKKPTSGPRPAIDRTGEPFA
jgi:hypothetical protein